MSIGTYGYVEIGSPRISGGGDGIQVVRRFSGPWVKRAEFLRYVFGSYDGVDYDPPKTLTECYHTVYPQTFQIEVDASLPVAKIDEVDSEWWGPGLTAGAEEADEENTEWGCCTIAITWKSPRGGGRSSETVEHNGATVSRRYNAYVEAMDVPGRTWHYADSGLPASEDVPAHLIINVIELEVTLANVLLPNWLAIFGLVGFVNDDLFEGFGKNLLLYMGAQIDSTETPFSDLPLYTIRYSFQSKMCRGQNIFNKTFNPATGGFEEIEDHLGNPPFPEGDFTNLYKKGTV